MKKLEDYLHLYLGCEMWESGGFPWELTPEQLYKKLLTGTALGNGTLKPILRSLSDMTEEEVNHCWKILDWSEMITIPERRRACLNEEFLDSEEGRECGWFSFCKLLPYLLSKHFDLFGLIESGLAIKAK